MLKYKYSIKRKLILLLGLTSVLALVIASMSNLVYYYYDDKDRIIKETIKLANVSGKNIAASLMFQDKKSTNMILNPILNDTDIKYIKVYDAKGDYFTSIGDEKYKHKNFQKDSFLDSKSTHFYVNSDYINILITINYTDEDIGFLEIVTSTDGIKNRIKEQFIVSLIIMLFTIFIIIIIAFRIEKIFSQPILDLLSAMKTINTVDIKLVPYTQDEFKELFLEFNKMSDGIKKRDEILKEHNLHLKSQVTATNDELSHVKDDLHKTTILASTDVLTNLFNRRYTMDKFDEMIIHAQSSKEYLGVIMLDIDHFKLVNDNLGHAAGDEVLIEVANILKETNRSEDIAGRIGGEEFLILCKNSDTQSTFNVAERLRKSVESKVITYEKDKTTQVRISLGVYSSIPKLSKEDLVKIADEALYNSKETGRNKVSIGEEKK